MSSFLPKPNVTPRPGTADEDGWRSDLQGIRAIAILLVLLAHAEVPGFSGGFIGIDIFFVLSGFLITQMLIREKERTGTISLKRFYVKRAKRLLPLATIVLVFIAGMSLILYPLTKQMEIGEQIIAAALYVVNWVFVFNDTNYFNQDFLSPVQHYWSLSVEEQFYFIWPALILAAGLIRPLRTRKTATVLIAILFIASFVFSMIYTSTNEASAYFSTLTRIWELAAGALLALVIPRALYLNPVKSSLMVLAGVMLIVVSLFVIDSSTPFPGYMALLPVLATILIIVGGTAINSGRLVYLFLARPVQYLGDMSYSWYLWHWPFVVFALVLFPEIGVLGLVAATLISLIPAHLSHFLIGEPIRKSRKITLKPIKSAVVFAAVSVFAAAVGFGLSMDRTGLDAAPDKTVASVKNGIQGQVMQTSAQSMTPNPVRAPYDRGLPRNDGCILFPGEIISPECRYGTSDPVKRVVLFGDSHAMHFFGALNEIAKRNDWQITTLLKVDCPVFQINLNKDCSDWRDRAIERIQLEKPDLVLVSAARKYSLDDRSRYQSQPYFTSGMKDTLNILKGTGAEAMFLGDIAPVPFTPNECVLRNLGNLRRCFFKENRMEKIDFDRRASMKTDTPYIDPVPVLCRRGVCPSVIGNIMVYSDVYHITDTFSRSLSYWLERKIRENQTASDLIPSKSDSVQES